MKLRDAGYILDRDAICKLAYQYAEKLGLKHNFDHENQMASGQWFESFIERHPMLSIRQVKGLTKEEANNFYKLLNKVLTDNDMVHKPENIYNMGKFRIQLKNIPQKENNVEKEGATVVNPVESAVKGETMTIVSCCNAIGIFLSPVFIMRGVNNKPEFKDGLPIGSKVFMNKHSIYLNTELFYKWFTEHFIPHKPKGKVLLILDEQSSYSSAPKVLQAAADKNIILLCLPYHTNSALQPQDRSVFGPFKTYFNKVINEVLRANPNKKLSCHNAGPLIYSAWFRAATSSNALAGFRSTGIYPFNPNALPDTEFLISDTALGSKNPDVASEPDEVERRTSTTQVPSSVDPEPEFVGVAENLASHEPVVVNERRSETPQAQTSASMDCQPDLIDEDKIKTYCKECFDYYSHDESDWIQCVMCKNWLHENCTLFRNDCSKCGVLKALSSFSTDSN